MSFHNQVLANKNLNYNSKETEVYFKPNILSFNNIIATSKPITIPINVPNANIYKFFSSTFESVNCDIQINNFDINYLSTVKSPNYKIDFDNDNFIIVNSFIEKNIFNKLFIYSNILNNNNTAYYSLNPINTLIIANEDNKSSNSIMRIQSNQKLNLSNVNLVLKYSKGFTYLPNYKITTIHNINEYQYKFKNFDKYQYDVNIYEGYNPGFTLEKIIIISKENTLLDYKKLELSYQILNVANIIDTKISYTVHGPLKFKTINDIYIDQVYLNIKPIEINKECIFQLNKIVFKNTIESFKSNVKNDLNNINDLSIENIKKFSTMFNFKIVTCIALFIYFTIRFRTLFTYKILYSNIHLLFILFIFNGIILPFIPNNIYLPIYTFLILFTLLFEMNLRKILLKIKINLDKNRRYLIIFTLYILAGAFFHSTRIESISEFIFSPIVIFTFFHLYLNILDYCLRLFTNKKISGVK